MLLYAMGEVGSSATNTVMIGDTTFDMEMACRAGTNAIGIGWGYHSEQELLSAGASIVISESSELAQAVESTLSA
jgi:phosphoglycolate phosphatase